MQRVILASGSVARRDFFSALNVPFEAIPADIDERAIRDVDLKVRAEKIARAKAETVAAMVAGIVISADTFIEVDGVVLEKPKDLEEARQMLRMQSGKWLKCYSGFCYLDAQNNINESTTVVINLLFRELDDQEIDTYVANYPVLTWSAAFSVTNRYGATFVAGLNGSFTGFAYGLPMELLVPLLRKSGITVQP